MNEIISFDFAQDRRRSAPQNDRALPTDWRRITSAVMRCVAVFVKGGSGPHYASWFGAQTLTEIAVLHYTP